MSRTRDTTPIRLEDWEATEMRIDNLTPGTIVELGFGPYKGALGKDDGAYTEHAVFRGITGSGDDRRAGFVSTTKTDGGLYWWEAYRVDGRWVMGSSAQRVSVLGIVSEWKPEA